MRRRHVSRLLRGPALVCAVVFAGAGLPDAEAIAERRVWPASADRSDPWMLVFRDEFDGRSLDPARWSTGFGWGNVSRSTYGYCDPDNNVVADGVLRQRIDRRGQGGRPFSVGCINSRGRFAQLYGYWEARIRAPGCHGGRGAFWGKPADESWPPELDIVELYGDARDTAEFTIHWSERPGSHEKDKSVVSGPDFSAGFHIFGAEWGPDGTTWYVDGVKRWHTAKGASYMDDRGPFYVMLEAQVITDASRCGIWPYYSSQYVDYVRIWRRCCDSP